MKPEAILAHNSPVPDQPAPKFLENDFMSAGFRPTTWICSGFTRTSTRERTGADLLRRLAKKGIKALEEGKEVISYFSSLPIYTLGKRHGFSGGARPKPGYCPQLEATFTDKERARFLERVDPCTAYGHL